MFCSVLLVAVGLLLALIGMVITFIICPPIFGFGWNAGTWGTAEEEVKKGKAEKRKVGWSKVGVCLLAFGTFLQLVGTVCQVILLACRG